MDRPTTPQEWVLRMKQGYVTLLKNQEVFPQQAQNPMRSLFCLAERISEAATRQAKGCTQKQFHKQVEQIIAEGGMYLQQLNLLGRVSIDNSANLSPLIAYKWNEAWYAFLTCIFEQFKADE